MLLTRRQTLKRGAAALTGLGLTIIVPFAARAQGNETMDDIYPTANGEIGITPINHASFVMTTPSLVVYNDPVGEVARYDRQPRPDLILVTHEHADHYNAETLAGLVKHDTRLVTNPAVFAMLPGDLKKRAISLANGDLTAAGDIGIAAIPAYNTTADRLKYHPQGRDNGYVLTIDGLKVYIAGDTEDTPEMRALTGIDIAFLPMNLPYTMDIGQAASAVSAFRPKAVYPYHYRGSDIEAFAALVAASGAATEVELRDWYA